MPPPRTPAASPARLGHSARHCPLRVARLRPGLAPAALTRVLHTIARSGPLTSSISVRQPHAATPVLSLLLACRHAASFAPAPLTLLLHAASSLGMRASSPRPNHVHLHAYACSTCAASACLRPLLGPPCAVPAPGPSRRRSGSPRRTACYRVPASAPGRRSLRLPLALRPRASPRASRAARRSAQAASARSSHPRAARPSQRRQPPSASRPGPSAARAAPASALAMPRRHPRTAALRPCARRPARCSRQPRAGPPPAEPSRPARAASRGAARSPAHAPHGPLRRPVAAQQNRMKEKKEREREGNG
jgi:hypothetical protein